MGFLILHISFWRTKYADLQLDLEIPLPDVTVERVLRVFTGQPPESL
jgi:hypothetical protein